MTYLVIPKEDEPFLTEWFDYPDKYIEASIVVNLVKLKYTKDGYTWCDLTEDHL